jgi:hypothetical protein
MFGSDGEAMSVVVYDTSIRENQIQAQGGAMKIAAALSEKLEF